MRDTKLAHMDLTMTQYGTFTEYSLPELNEGFDELRKLRQILNSCASSDQFGVDLKIPHDDYRTEMFIHSHSLVNGMMLLKDGLYKRKVFPGEL